MWRTAVEVREIGEALIASVGRHSDLQRARIEYVFIDEAPESKGRTVWGRARRISGLPAFLARRRPVDVHVKPDPFFVIEISEDIWNTLNYDQQRALVDHELSHCVVDENNMTGEVRLSTRGHDFEEFAGVLQRHGFWNIPTARLGAVVADQLAAAIDEADQTRGHTDGDTGDGDAGAGD